MARRELDVDIAPVAAMCRTPSPGLLEHHLDDGDDRRLVETVSGNYTHFVETYQRR